MGGFGRGRSVLAGGLFLALVVVMVLGPTGRPAAAAESTVTVTDPIGDVADPAGDITSVIETIRPGSLTLETHVASAAWLPPGWKSHETAAWWSLDTNSDGAPDYLVFLAGFFDAQGNNAWVVPVGGAPNCSARTGMGGGMYQVHVEGPCVGNPVSVRVVAGVTYDLDPAHPGTTMQTDVAPDSGWGPRIFSGTPFGSLDAASPAADGSVSLSGWAIDPQAPTIQVHVYVDGAFVATATTDVDRPDVSAAFPEVPGTHGFALTVGPLAEGAHDVCAYGINVGQGENALLSCRTVVTRGTAFHGLTPARILDSRGTAGGWNGKLSAGSPRTLQVTGLGGGSNVPPTATAVVMNVAVTNGTTGSFLTLYPTGSGTPNASNLNFGAGQTIANLVTMRLGTGGTVSFANAVGSTDVVADVVGYYDDGAGAGALFTGVTPTRVLDSRTPNGGWNGKLAAGAPRDLTVRQPNNPSGVPTTATAIVVNVTATDATKGSFVSVWPSGVDQPNVSNLNFGPGQTIPNLAIVQIGANGAIRLANAVGAVDVVVDVVGYFDPSGGSRYHPINPTRILDSRVGTGLTGPWGAGASRALPVAGAAATKVPPGATGLVANVTATGATAGSFIIVFPDGVSAPLSSNLNFAAGETIPNLVTVKVPANGQIAFYNHLGAVDIVTDAVGYYAPT